jgi:nitrite reductase/ring-hydroxylating ferredoxin subunit
MEATSGGEWKEVASLSDFSDTDRKLVDLGGTKQIGLFKVEDELFAVSIWCSHQKMSMFHGDLDGYELMCPLHGARFDLRSGKNLSLPAVRPIPAYPLKVENDVVYVKV